MPDLRLEGLMRLLGSKSAAPSVLSDLPSHYRQPQIASELA